MASALVRAVTLFCLLLFVTPSLSISATTCCPTLPTQLCDFYFEGYRDKVPTFYLNDGINGDHLLVPVPPKSLSWAGSREKFSPAVYNTIIGKKVHVASTNLNATFLTCPIPLPSWMNGGNQFYLSGSQDNVGRLSARTWQKQTLLQMGKQYYVNRCVYLPITAATLNTDKGDVNLNPGDGNPEFPEYRRCIVFRTAL